MKAKRYEPENINGIMIMLPKEGGRYMLTSDYERVDGQLLSLCETISKLKNTNAELRLMIAHQAAANTKQRQSI